MAQLVVRNLDDDVKTGLKLRARANGRSTEEEVRVILRAAVAEDPMAGMGLGSRLAARFAGIGLTEPLEELRGGTWRIPDFES